MSCTATVVSNPRMLTIANALQGQQSELLKSAHTSSTKQYKAMHGNTPEWQPQDKHTLVTRQVSTYRKHTAHLRAQNELCFAEKCFDLC